VNHLGRWLVRGVFLLLEVRFKLRHVGVHLAGLSRDDARVAVLLEPNELAALLLSQPPEEFVLGDGLELETYLNGLLDLSRLFVLGRDPHVRGRHVDEPRDLPALVSKDLPVSVPGDLLLLPLVPPKIDEAPVGVHELKEVLQLQLLEPSLELQALHLCLDLFIRRKHPLKIDVFVLPLFGIVEGVGLRLPNSLEPQNVADFFGGFLSLEVDLWLKSMAEPVDVRRVGCDVLRQRRAVLPPTQSPLRIVGRFEEVLVLENPLRLVLVVGARRWCSDGVVAHYLRLDDRATTGNYITSFVC
jgi:hypothetical protein